jgi:hypothetical protein
VKAVMLNSFVTSKKSWKLHLLQIDYAYVDWLLCSKQFETIYYTFRRLHEVCKFKM